jgi:hypothetical protein
MKKQFYLVMLFSLVCYFSKAQVSIKTIEKIHKKYYNNWPKTISFSQKTTFYGPKGERNETWHECGIFPDFFRISLGDIDKGNAMIFNKDKEYIFREGKLTRTDKNSNFLIYLAGGMYFEPLDSVKKKLAGQGIDLNQGYEQVINGNKIVVIGTNVADSTKSQLWINTDKLHFVKFCHKDGDKLLEVKYDGHKKFGNVWYESIVDIIVNGKLRQKEEYFDFKTNVKLNESLFDPNNFSTENWMK